MFAPANFKYAFNIPSQDTLSEDKSKPNRQFICISLFLFRLISIK